MKFLIFNRLRRIKTALIFLIALVVFYLCRGHYYDIIASIGSQFLLTAYVWVRAAILLTFGEWWVVIELLMVNYAVKLLVSLAFVCACGFCIYLLYHIISVVRRGIKVKRENKVIKNYYFSGDLYLLISRYLS